ncbi:MAG: DUF975 family protein [Bacillota bacterium]
MNNIISLKRSGKALMKGNYIVVISFLLITTIISSIIFYYQNIISLEIRNGLIFIIYRIPLPIITIFGLLGLIVNSSFTYSKLSIFIDITNNKKINIIYKLKLGFIDNLFRNIWLYIFRNILILLWSLLLIVPGIIKAYTYSLAFYLINKKSSLNPPEAIRYSIKLTRGHKKKLFLLDLSYLPWYLLGILTAGILWLWIYPQHKSAKTLIYNKIYNDSNLSKLD